MAEKDYRIAAVGEKVLRTIRQAEDDIRKDVRRDIVLIAYEKDDARQTP